MSDKPIPEVYATEGWGNQRYEALDPNTYDPCYDPDCKCHTSRGNIRGFGATPEDAVANFWEQYDEHDDTQAPIRLDAEDL
jgi:hypothetical protein